MAKTVSLCIIGTEITTGIIQDKHIFYLTNALVKLNYEIKKIEIIGDYDDIKGSLNECLLVSDTLIVTGGLGPTSDDITRNAISETLNKKLVLNEEALSYLKSYLKREVDDINLRQALIPTGFNIIENKKGTACGFYSNIDNKLIISLPGPVKELRSMFEESVLKILNPSIDNDNKRDEFSIYLMPEAYLEEILQSFKIQDVRWSTRFQDHHINLYLSGKNKDILKDKLKKRLSILMQEGDISLSALLDKSLNDKRVSFVESSGYLSSYLRARENKAFKEALILDSFFNSELLSVDNFSNTIYNTKSKAIAYANNLLKMSKVDIAISIIGEEDTTTYAIKYLDGMATYRVKIKNRNNKARDKMASMIAILLACSSFNSDLQLNIRDVFMEKI